MFLAYVKNGVYNNSSTGDTTWYNSMDRYDCGLVIMVKADTTTTPTYATSGSQNYGAISYLYKSSSSSATSYGRSGSMTANTYTSSSTNASTLAIPKKPIAPPIITGINLGTCVFRFLNG